MLAVGKLLEVSFLRKPVCWVPHGVSLEVPCEALPVSTEDKFQELPFPYGLSDADCEWFERHSNTLSGGENRAKVAEYKSSAESGNAYGQNLFGGCYYYGLGVAVDKKRAVELYTLSAEQGNAWGQFNLGYCFQYGHSVAVDLSLAKQWYGRAAAQGEEFAIEALEELNA